MAQRLSKAIDPFLLLLAGVAALGVVAPATGRAAAAVNDGVFAAIALLFFVYGLRLSFAAVVEGLKNWRLQLLVAGCTFILFPVLGLATSVVASHAMPMPLVIGVIFLCALPSTMQSSIAFTSIARGDISAAFCSASISSLLGIVATPALVAVLLQAKGGASWDSVRSILLQLLVPFIVGQALRPFLGVMLDRAKGLTRFVDRGSILIVVYAAFSEGTAAGIWSQVTPANLLAVGVIDLAILGVVLAMTRWTSRRLGFSAEEEIAIVFCGSKKSLAAGIPMANILFAGQAVGIILLPMMVFHQIQLFVCAIIAQRYRARS